MDRKPYEKWSKPQLIERILQLEGKATTPSIPLPKMQKSFDFSKRNSRFIALKFAYLGWNYQGLAYQKDKTELPTVEGVILQALAKCKMISSPEPASCNFSRCGRTDKGVSAMNQVISLKVRSNLSESDQKDPQNDSRELDYVSILNQLLPADIKLHSVCLRPPQDFDARFSCQLRHYKYTFSGEGLDIGLMGLAAEKFIGTHDFRNFCKVDGSKQIVNFFREIKSAKIIPSGDFFVFDLVGTAFLWHQVRCMMAVLFMVGQKLESVDIVDHLLNVDKTPRKPNYMLGHDVPLVLYDCIFDEMEWIGSFDSGKTAKNNLTIKGMVHDYQVKSVIASMFKSIALIETPTKLVLNNGDGKGQLANTYVKLADRECSDTPAEVNEKWRVKRRKV